VSRKLYPFIKGRDPERANIQSTARVLWLHEAIHICQVLDKKDINEQSAYDLSEWAFFGEKCP